jgi:hypothetical protein
MRLRHSVLSAALAALLFTAALPQPASSASVDGAFAAAVAKILNSVRNQQQFLRDLSASEFKQFVSCTQGVMAAAPQRRKEYVLAAGNANEMRQRFDEVALDNRAALKQRITRECS